MQIVAVCNQKGGVGKTTLTINLGAALARLGQRVLLVDLDPHGHLTEGVGLGEAYLGEQVTLYTALVGTDKAVTIAIDQLLQQPPTEPFAVIPSSYELMLAEQALYLARNREHKLAGLLGQLDGRFDWVLIDCPPVLGNLTDNALTAARTHNVFGDAERGGLYLYADKGYAGGEGPVLLTPYKGRSLPDSYRQANRCHAALCANGERGFAVLKSWKVFDRFRGCPRHVGAFARAVLTLEHGPQ